MKTSRVRSIVQVLVGLSGLMWRLLGATLYVWSESPDPKPPYTNWTTAARVIQDAVDAASAGDEVVVTNGVYATGGRAVDAAGTNRVAVTKPLTLRSVNGPEFTVIEGYQVPGTTNGTGAVRCVYLADGASLSGFTLTKGATRTSGEWPTERSGGGVCCASTNAVVTNCVLVGNSAWYGGGAYRGTLYNCSLTDNYSAGGGGGGAYESTLYNCTLTGNVAARNGGGAYRSTLYNCTLTCNSAESGGGALYSTLYNCTLTGNSAEYGGGARDSTLHNSTVTGNSARRGGGVYGSTACNSIVCYNMADFWENYSDSTLNYCCTTPLPLEGVGNIHGDPQLVSSGHIALNSPCRGAGNAAYATGVDIDGEPWASPPSIGCDEVHPEALTGALAPTIQASFDDVAVGYPLDLTGFVEGNATANAWDFGDGGQATNRVYVTHAWSWPGDYKVTFTAFNSTHPEGVSTNVTIRVVEAVHYVSAKSVNPVPPYTSWATAARNIQDAVDAATVRGATVLVTNGTYAAGECRGSDGSTNRVVVNKPLILRSVDGPKSTVIDGNGKMRCIYLATGAILSGFTLTNGRAGDYGGGVYAESWRCVITNCMLTGNSTVYAGGGAFRGTLYNCSLTVNSAQDGGGASESALYNCTVTCNSAGSGGGALRGALYNCTLTGNSARRGGGLYLSTAYNSIVYCNMADFGENYSDSTLNYCCTTPLPLEGVGDIHGDPKLVSSGHIALNSPCRGAGNGAYSTGVDTDGEPWATPPSIGCDEVHPEALTGPLALTIQASFENVAVGYPLNLTGFVEGNATANAWDFGDGGQATNRVYVTHAWTSAGDYKVTFTAFNNTHPEGVSTKVTIRVVEAVHYVSAKSVNPVPPYTSWATAARNIQDAVDAATVRGATVLVTNGRYAAGECRGSDGSTNRVVVNKPLILRSVDGPKSTVIDGNGKMRCIYLATGAILSGFTLANGSAWNGGGVYAEPWACVITNCLLAGNWAREWGGGAYGGTLHNCTSIGNSAYAGGGASESILYDCTVTGNSAGSGGGAWESTLYNCTLRGNSANEYGGGAAGSTLYNCTLTRNSAELLSGGAAGGTLYNCIVCFNEAPYGPNYYDAAMNYCCTTPLPTNGIGNIDADPRFVNAPAGDFRLLPDSPCIDAGTNLTDIVSTDIVGLSRPLDGDGDGVARFDIGAYEFNPYRFVRLVFDQFAFKFTIEGEPGRLVRLEQSRDLVNWEEAAVVPLPASGQTLFDAGAMMEPHQFYRAVSLY